MGELRLWSLCHIDCIRSPRPMCLSRKDIDLLELQASLFQGCFLSPILTGFPSHISFLLQEQARSPDFSFCQWQFVQRSARTFLVKATSGDASGDGTHKPFRQLLTSVLRFLRQWIPHLLHHVWLQHIIARWERCLLFLCALLRFSQLCCRLFHELLLLLGQGHFQKDSNVVGCSTEEYVRNWAVFRVLALLLELLCSS